MDDIERNGRKYRVEIMRDDNNDPPWKNEDGHGPVSDWTTREKRPGERVLSRDRNNYRFYDFAAAVQLARAEGWDTPPYKTGTPGERAARAAEADFRHLQAWCNDEWYYIGVIVTPLCQCCGQPIKGKSESVWGIESDSDDSYLTETALDLVAEAEANAADKTECDA